MTRLTLATVCLVATGLLASASPAQDAGPEPRSIGSRLGDQIDPVIIEGASARTAFEWWSRTTGIPLVIDWNAMEDEGIDPETTVTLSMRNVPAGQLLGLLMRLIAGQQTVLYESTPWYIQVMTKAQANRNLVMRVYQVGDLLHEIPAFRAPSFDLRDSLSNTNSGGGGGGGAGGGQLFGDRGGEPERDSEPVKSKSERGSDLAEMIRQTVEPDVWIENGGLSSVRYFNGRLIVNAPLYVHAQIGIPVVTPEKPGEGLGRPRGTDSPSGNDVQPTWGIVRPRSAEPPTSGKQTIPPKPVSGQHP